ncbi:hypothetical protein, partial [Aeromonas allosaccharophila]|uniref:hypothetical protein n=1 Tax=Aeromonas allosaccharophila TaxID=656 RepID=UPI003D1F30AF
RDDVSALRIRVFTLAGMAVQLRRNTQPSPPPPQPASAMLDNAVTTDKARIFFFIFIFLKQRCICHRHLAEEVRMGGMK